jgi:hypothetical protein
MELFALAFVPVVAIPAVTKAPQIVSSVVKAIGSIFGGGKDYISAQIGIFGGGGNRDMSWTQSSPELAAYHYDQVIKRLGFIGLANPSTDQRRAFWNAWDSTMPADADSFRNLPASYFSQVSATSPGNFTPYLIAGGVALIALIFIMRR